MTRTKIVLPIVCALALAVQAFLSEPGHAQTRFAPAIQVGDTIVTSHQLNQRTRFLSLLNAPGDPRQLAKEQLINEELQLIAASEAGVTPSDDEVKAGMEEFASRANLSADQFIEALGQNGVGAETFRDFIGAGVAWRSFIRATFAESGREFPQDLIRRTFARTGTEGGLRVLVSEILLPATTPETAAASRVRAREVSALAGEEAFSKAARELSVAASASNGGALNWVALDSLPEEVRGTISRLTPGQVSAPVELENAIAVFLLRDVERVAAGTPSTLLIDYALFITDGDRTRAREIAEGVDVCDDLYGVAKGLPEERLIRETRAANELPADIRNALSALDENEVDTGLVRSGNAAVLMLCERKAGLESAVDIDIVGNRLLNARLGAIAADYLANLRANTIVVDLTN